jgi:nucleoside-diphosphate-sugar epimerase
VTTRRILVTGASGFVGRHCLPLLAAAGYEAHAVASRAPQRPTAGVRWHAADLLDARQSSTLVERVRPTHLLHLAWYVAPGEYLNSPENLPWVGASLELLRAFAASGGRRVVMAGTCLEYEPGHEYCSEQVTPLRPRSLYGACKHAAQVVLSAFARESGLSAAWGRLFFLFGPHEGPQRFVPSVVNALLRGREAFCSHGRQVRDFLYVRDAASALVALAGSGVTGPVNVASGQPRRLAEIAGMIGELVGRAELIRLGAVPAPEDEPASITADVTRLREEVGWLPAHDMNAALRETVEWWRGRAQGAL